MALTQFTDQWNQTFDLKITVGDIKKPTQSFLTEIFEMFLTLNHIDCNKLKAKMDERHYKIWIVNYFSELFRALKAKYTFIYGDFIQPVSKKCFEVLRFLLNYHLFIKEVVQDEVIHTADSKIETFNQLLAKKNQLHIHQEEFKIRSEKKEQALIECKQLIAENKQSLLELEAKFASLKQATDLAEEELSRVKNENIKLSSEIKELQPLVVTEDELNRAMSAIKAADEQVSQLNSMKESLESQNECFNNNVIQINAEIDEFSIVSNENSVLDRVEKYRDDLKHFTESNNKIKEFQNQIENTMAKRVVILESIKTMEVQLVKKRSELTSILETSQIKTMAMESEYKRSLIHTINYEKKLEMAEQQIEDLKLTQEHLITMGIDVIEHIENS